MLTALDGHKLRLNK